MGGGNAPICFLPTANETPQKEDEANFGAYRRRHFVFPCMCVCGCAAVSGLRRVFSTSSNFYKIFFKSETGK